jgi:predicted TIM-barrel fold metal-dependent hydrolase
LTENACDADYLIAEMDYAGVDVAVLQNDHFYGSLNDFFSDAVARYPDRLIGTAHIDEMTIGQPAAIDQLEDAVERLGLRGIFYDSRSYWTGSPAYAVDEPAFAGFWSAVERRKVVVQWIPGAPIGSGTEGLLAQYRRWQRLLERFPDLKMIVPGGIPANIAGEPVIAELAATGNVCFELCYPIGSGRVEEYPYPVALAEIERVYNAVGARALAWGSDMPNVLRHCTYAQTINQLRCHAPFIPAADMNLILGDNLARFFGLNQ